MAVEELVEMGDAAIPALEPLATSPGIALERKYAISILGSIGTKRAVEILLCITMHSPKYGEATFRVGLVRIYSKGSYGRHGVEWFVYGGNSITSSMLRTGHRAR